MQHSGDCDDPRCPTCYHETEEEKEHRRQKNYLFLSLDERKFVEHQEVEKRDGTFHKNQTFKLEYTKHIPIGDHIDDRISKRIGTAHLTTAYDVVVFSKRGKKFKEDEIKPLFNELIAAKYK